MTAAATGHVLQVMADDTRHTDFACDAVSGHGIAGLREDHHYRFTIKPALSFVYVDDVALIADSDGSYRWMPALYAGRVEVTGIDRHGQAHHWWLDVSPTPGKLGQDELDAMIRDIRTWQSRLLQGASPALMPFGMEGRPGLRDELVQLSRLMRHGPGFLTTLRHALASPRSMLRVAHEDIPVARVRKVHPAALRDRRVVTALAAPAAEGPDADNLLLRAQTVAVSLDTPAHRALKHLLTRFRSRVERLAQRVDREQLAEEPEEQKARRMRRLHVLGGLRRQADELLHRSPMTAVTRCEATGAGLTQITAHPAYSRAYRHGMDALRSGLEGDNLRDLQHVSYTWGIYETWCFLALADALQQAFSRSWEVAASKSCLGDISLVMTLPDQRWLEAVFQAVFPSERPHSGKQAWSISRERRPDILLALHDGHDIRTLILDAKYRSGRSNLLDAMASAHVYHDALRINGQRPGSCLLLAPGDLSDQVQADPEYRKAHGVGMVRLRHEIASVDLVIELVREWMSALQ